MSVSVQDIDLEMLCECESESRPGRGWHRTWNRELRNCVLPFEGTDGEFLETFVPSHATELQTVALEERLARLKPVNTNRHLNTVRRGLRALVADFPDKKRPSFFDNSVLKSLSFPFHVLAASQPKFTIDLAMGAPGTPAPADIDPGAAWGPIACLIQVRASRAHDPFRHKGAKRTKALVKLALAANALMLAKDLLAAFAIGVYGDRVRIIRFDRAGAVFSRPLALGTKADVNVLRNFLWRFVNPSHAGARADDVVGCDATVDRLPFGGGMWLKKRLAKIDPSFEPSYTELNEARIKEVVGSDGRKERYIVFRVINACTRLFSRGTIVALAVRDTRNMSGRNSTELNPEDLRLCVVKETWRMLDRQAETDFYDRLKAVGAQGVGEDAYGVQTMVIGADMGEALGELHQTNSWRGTKTTSKRYCGGDRSQLRFVMAVVGKPITEFDDEKEMTQAFRDAIIGHSNCTSMGAILQHDVSAANLLIVKRIPGQRVPFTGFLHDFDYSIMTPDVPLEKDRPLSPEELHDLLRKTIDRNVLCEHIGTHDFCAYERIAPATKEEARYRTSVPHGIHHDLESFYWVLLDVVLLTLKNSVKGGAICFQNVDSDKIFASRESKLNWLTEYAPDFVIDDCQALTWLVREYGRLVYEDIQKIGRFPLKKEFSLTYENVISLFDQALMIQWPVADDSRMEAFPAGAARRQRRCRCEQSRERRARRCESDSSVGSDGTYSSDHVFDGDSNSEGSCSDDADVEDERGTLDPLPVGRFYNSTGIRNWYNSTSPDEAPDDCYEDDEDDDIKMGSPTKPSLLSRRDDDYQMGSPTKPSYPPMPKRRRPHCGINDPWAARPPPPPLPPKRVRSWVSRRSKYGASHAPSKVEPDLARAQTWEQRDFEADYTGPGKEGLARIRAKAAATLQRVNEVDDIAVEGMLNGSDEDGSGSECSL